MVAGLIDWGDACHSWLVAEAAIAVCYMMQLTADRQPFTSAAALLVGARPPPTPRRSRCTCILRRGPRVRRDGYFGWAALRKHR